MAVFGKLLKELFGKTVLTGPKAGGNATSGTKVTTISGGIATLLTWYLQKKGYDVIVEPELIAAFTVIIAQWFHRKGGDEQAAAVVQEVRVEGSTTRSTTEAAVMDAATAPPPVSLPPRRSYAAPTE